MLGAREPRAGLFRLFIADDAANLVKGGFLEPIFIKRCGAGEKLIKQHAQRVDVASGVDIRAAVGGLFGGHIERRADHLGKAGEEGFLGQLLPQGLGDAEVDDLDDGGRVELSDHDVGGFQVAMDDALLVGVLDGVADGDKKLEPARAESRC